MVCLKQTRVLLTHGGLIMSNGTYGVFYCEELVSGRRIEYELDPLDPSGKRFFATASNRTEHSADVQVAVEMDIERRRAKGEEQERL